MLASIVVVIIIMKVINSFFFQVKCHYNYLIYDSKTNLVFMSKPYLINPFY